MLRALVFLLLAYIGLLLETTIFLFVHPFFIRLDIIAPAICWYALEEDFAKGIVTTTLLGIIASSFSCLSTIIYVASYLLAFITVFFIKVNVLELSRVQAYLITGFITIEILVVQLAGSGVLELLWPWGIIQASLNILVSPIIFRIFDHPYELLLEIRHRFSHEKRQ